MRKKTIVLSLLFLLLISTNNINAQSVPDSIGICHQASDLGNQNITWSYISGEGLWSILEPTRRSFNWSSVDSAVNLATRNGKKIWIQVLTDDGGENVIPQWAINSGMGILPDPIPVSTATNCPFTPGQHPSCANYEKNNRPTQWDPLYLQYLQEILTAMAAKYDNNDTVEAILMMSGGHYGEASLQVKYYRWDPNPDANNPYNAYIAEMARVKGETVNAIAAPYNGYISKFDYYFIENSKRIVDMYAQTFHNKAIVIQSGSGLSGDGEKVAGEVIDYAVNTYGKRIWLKQNGWGNWVLGYGNGQDDWYNTLFSRYKNRTRIIREVGHLENMCFKNYNTIGQDRGHYHPTPTPGHPQYQCPNNADTGCCKRTDSAEALDYNTKLVNATIDAGTSAICFQSNFFQTYSPTIFPGIANQFPSIKNRLEENYRNYYPQAPTYTPTPTLTPIPTNSPTPICPGVGTPVTTNQFNNWKSEFIKPVPNTSSPSNFNCDNEINLIDFEIWRNSFTGN